MATNIVIINTDDRAFKPHPQFPQLDVYLQELPDMIPRNILSNVIVIRAYTVGKEPSQLDSYKSGIIQIKNKYPQLFMRLVPQYLNNDIVRCSKMKPCDIVEWLRQGNIHRLLGHFHQGRDLSRSPDWNVIAIESEILKLKFHLGTPSGSYVSDPILLQDKFNYLAALKDDTLPTLKIPLMLGTNYVELIPLLNSFCMHNLNTNDPSQAGFVIKIPYTTNQKYRKTNSIEDILRKIIRLRDKFYETIPYVMLQPYLHDTVEYKVVCFNGKAMYEAQIANSSRVSLSKKTFSNPKTRFEFAESVLRKLKERCNFAELSSLVRVDIFWCSSLNKIVVNELETLEARFDASNKDTNKQIFLQSLLAVYHANTLLTDIGRLINQQLELIEYPKWPSVWDIVNANN